MGVLDKTQEPPGAAGDVEEAAAADVSRAQETGDRRQGLAAHGVCAAGKEYLNLIVVELADSSLR